VFAEFMNTERDDQGYDYGECQIVSVDYPNPAIRVAIVHLGAKKHKAKQ
jgi:hypothetical protein